MATKAGVSCQAMAQLAFIVLVPLGLLVTPCGVASAQAPAMAAPGTARPARPGGPRPSPPKYPSPPKKRDGKPGKPDDKKKPDEKKGGKDDKKKADSSKVVERPTEPSAKPDPEQLKVKPDKDGKVSFNFKGQPWPKVLDWLAEISNMSLDWQKAPADYLNLTTQRPYTVAETRDLINRYLLKRGFTLLCQDGIMSLAEIKGLDPSTVPRVAPEALAERAPYDFVKVSFSLGSGCWPSRPSRSSNRCLAPTAS